MSVETELLLRCARTRIDAQASDDIRMFAQDSVDWRSFISMSLQHCVAPLVYRALNEICPKAVPTSVLNELRQYDRENITKSFFLTSEMLKLIHMLDSQGVNAVPFKGPVLAIIAYNDLTLRQFGDLDILIQRRDLDKTRKFLLSHGYRPWRNMTRAEEAAHLKFAHAFTFIREDERVTVDLHWRLAQSFYSFKLDSTALWNQLDQISVAGRVLTTLRLEDLLLYLCNHGSKHAWERLAWVCDVAELVGNHENKLDWTKVIEKSQVLGNERTLLLGTGLARDFCGANLPPVMSYKIEADPAVKALIAHVRQRLSSRDQKPLGFFERTVMFVKMREKLNDRVAYLRYRFRVAFAPNEKDLNLLPWLPDSFYFLYYPLRIARLTVAYATHAVGRLRHGK